MSFSISAAGHVIGEDAAQIEKDLIADLKNLFSLARYAPHVHSATFFGQHTGSVDIKTPTAEEAAAQATPAEVAPPVNAEAAPVEAPQVTEPVVGEVHDATPAESPTPPTA
jgi:hypothetical protein